MKYAEHEKKYAVRETTIWRICNKNSKYTIKYAEYDNKSAEYAEYKHTPCNMQNHDMQ